EGDVVRNLRWRGQPCWPRHKFLGCDRLAKTGMSTEPTRRMNAPEIKVLANPAEVARAAAERVLELSESAIEPRGRFANARSGGWTRKGLYQLLASPDFAPHLDWPSIDVFFADERCVPPDHSDSNYRLARETLLSKVPIPGDNVYRMRGEAPDANEAAKE